MVSKWTSYGGTKEIFAEFVKLNFGITSIDKPMGSKCESKALVVTQNPALVWSNARKQLIKI